MIVSESKVNYSVDVCVVGGGLAGLFAAVSAARHGAKVLLMQDRPVLGGNASSEVRMWVRGAVASGKENRETGLIQEVEMENIYRNPTMNYSLWDSVLYQLATSEPNLTLLLNTSCLGVEMNGEKIASVTGWQINSYTFHAVQAKLFIDASGDSILAPLSGAKYRVGREGQDEFNEYAAPNTADLCSMGSSVLIQARETDHPCTFIKPEWAYTYLDDESMYLKNHDIRGTNVNFWWIELGGDQDTIHDAQTINEELLRVAYGVWDHIKNQGDHGMENWELEWVGFLPGKRESRRYEGAYILNQRDLEEGNTFPDAVAFGGWTMDNHNPKGFKYMGYSSKHITTAAPYQIPFRSLYSVNVPNLLFAGRNISATHMAMSSTRIMGTCSVVGQAAGTGAAVAIAHGCLPADVTEKHILELQALLLEDGCFIPGLLRQPTGTAKPQLPAEDLAVLENGWERPQNGLANTTVLPEGLTINFTQPTKVLRLALDPDFSRESISNDKHYQKFAMRAHIHWPEKRVSMPANLLRACTVTARTSDGTETVIPVTDNRQIVLSIPLPDNTISVILTDLVAWESNEVRVFSIDAAK